jgi:hypothetical protein
MQRTKAFGQTAHLGPSAGFYRRQSEMDYWSKRTIQLGFFGHIRFTSERVHANQPVRVGTRFEKQAKQPLDLTVARPSHWGVTQIIESAIGSVCWRSVPTRAVLHRSAIFKKEDFFG